MATDDHDRTDRTGRRRRPRPPGPAERPRRPGAPARARLLRRRVARDLHARDHEGAREARARLGAADRVRQRESVPAATRPSTRTSTRCAARPRSDGFRTRVVIDIISGTSAGGINGVCLAKAIALDAPQDGLRDLWLTKGAILKLLSRLAEAAAARGQPDAEVARRRLQRDGRQRAGHADAAGSRAEPVRDDDGHQRLQPARSRSPIRRRSTRSSTSTSSSSTTATASATSTARTTRRSRSPRARRRASRARSRRRRSPTSSTQQARRELPGRVLPRLRARRLAGRPDVLRRRRRARQLPVQACGSRDRRQARLDAGRPAAPLHRARPGRARARPRRVDAGIPRDDLGGALEAAAPAADRRRARRADAVQPTRPARQADDRRRRGRRARDRRAAARSSTTTRRTTQANTGAIGSSALRLPGVPAPEAPLRRRGHRDLRLGRPELPADDDAGALRAAVRCSRGPTPPSCSQTDGELSDEQRQLPAHVRPRLRPAPARVRDRPVEPLLRRRRRPRAAERAQASASTSCRRARRSCSSARTRGVPAATRSTGSSAWSGFGPYLDGWRGREFLESAKAGDRRAARRARHVSSTRRSTASASARTRELERLTAELPAEIRDDLKGALPRLPVLGRDDVSRRDR